MRGAPIAIPLFDGCPTVQDETCIAVRNRCASVPIPFTVTGGAQKRNAVCSVACLEWAWWITYPPMVSRPGTLWESTLETMSAKEAKSRVACSGKHLGCSVRDGRRIAVRTQWQFGPSDGNILAWALMGNPRDGDARQPLGKSNRTSSRKINSVPPPLFYDYYVSGS